MPLAKCPVCDRDVSTQAFSCPHCGHSFASAVSAQTPTAAHSVESSAATVRKGGLYMIGALLVLGALVWFYRAFIGEVAYGEHPAYLVGNWSGVSDEGGARLSLSANGRYTEDGNPGNTDHKTGVWGVFPDAPRNYPSIRICFKDGSRERCTPQSLADLQNSRSWMNPYFYVMYHRTP